MGFFNRLSPKNSHSIPAASNETKAPAPVPGVSGILPLLVSAREKLEAKDLPGAMAIYEELLAAAGDRPDVLVTLSGDLGSCGYVDQIVELVAPRYDAERHGPATGINLLQAYLATRNTNAAQHLLDILFGLQRPELEERLYGFSNALAELIEAENRGQLAPPSPITPNGVDPSEEEMRRRHSVNLVSISKPVWSYGLEALPDLLPPVKEGRLRRVAFGQLALIGVSDWAEKMKDPEDELARFSRGLPLWLGESLYFCPHYKPITAVGIMGKDHYVIFGAEWTTENIRQLVDTAGEGIDYVFTGALRSQLGDFELVLRVWEVKKSRERKTFTARWTPATADAELTKLQEQIHLFMEWSPYPAGSGLAYAAPNTPTGWCDTLGTTLTFFLADKAVLPATQLAAPAEALARVAGRASQSEAASLAWLALRDRAIRLGLAEALPPSPALFPSPAVERTQQSFTS